MINHFAGGLDCPMSILLGRSVGRSVGQFLFSSRLSNDIYFECVLYTICERAGVSLFSHANVFAERRQFLKSTNIQRTLMNDSIVNLFSTQYHSLPSQQLPMKIIE